MALMVNVRSVVYGYEIVSFFSNGKRSVNQLLSYRAKMALALKFSTGSFSQRFFDSLVAYSQRSDFRKIIQKL